MKNDQLINGLFLSFDKIVNCLLIACPIFSSRNAGSGIVRPILMLIENEHSIVFLVVSFSTRNRTFIREIELGSIQFSP